jgi:hypothetical protein
MSLNPPELDAATSEKDLLARILKEYIILFFAATLAGITSA